MSDIKVSFHSTEQVDDSLLKFAVIAAVYKGKWIFCRHKERSTYEIPGGHRESGEAISDTARRELYEETGAESFTLSPICPYSVTREAAPSYGMLFYAEVSVLSNLPETMEMAEVQLFDKLPVKLTYPHIQPYLFEKARVYQRLYFSNSSTL